MQFMVSFYCPIVVCFTVIKGLNIYLVCPTEIKGLNFIVLCLITA